MTSKNFIFNLGDGSFATVELWCTSTPNQENNTSTITAVLWGQTKSNSTLNIGSRPGTVHTVNGGDSKSYTANPFYRTSAGWTELGRTTHVVTHNSDGSKTVTMNASYPIQSSVSGTYYSTINVGGSFVLDTIPRGMVHVGDSSGTPRRGQVWVGDSNGVPRKAIGVWVGDNNGTPRRAK